MHPLFNNAAQMTDEQINAVIARECGDYICECCKDICKYCDTNYCNDLNAMHEAEKFLTKDRNSYLTALAELVSTDDLRGQDADWPWVCATARQRAEAFLRTLGKWQEEK
jgi:hypothetical protein